MRRNVAVYAILICLSTSTALRAQTPADRAAEVFRNMDTNHDGTISLAEWQAAGRRERGFKLIDTDHDGQITPTELRAAAARYRNAR